MFPKVIHYCWFGGNPLPENSKKYIDTWRTCCPDYEIKQWDEKSFDIDSCVYTRQAADNRKWAFVADYFRFWVVYHHGGVYLDTDVRLYSDFNRFLEFDFFCGHETDTEFEPAIFGGIAGNDICAAMLNYFHKQEFVVDGEPDLLPLPSKFTAIMKNEFSLSVEPTETRIVDNVALLKKSIFHPAVSNRGKSIITEETVAQHCYNASWVDGKTKRHIKIYNFLIKIFGKKFTNRIIGKK